MARKHRGQPLRPRGRLVTFPPRWSTRAPAPAPPRDPVAPADSSPSPRLAN